ncbi:hypothetical protein Q1695_004388 [Nippostrongylus brasiliensis]|nr:hypothetical protein Q1695_004388 [Nippostrongylus brasiliensis]
MVVYLIKYEESFKDDKETISYANEAIGDVLAEGNKTQLPELLWIVVLLETSALEQLRVNCNGAKGWSTMDWKHKKLTQMGPFCKHQIVAQRVNENAIRDLRKGKYKDDRDRLQETRRDIIKLLKKKVENKSELLEPQ